MKRILFILLLISLNFLNAVNLSSTKVIYLTGERIHIKVKDLEYHPKTWIAIYPKGEDNSGSRVIEWKWVKKTPNSDIYFKPLSRKGDYIVRIMYNNSYHVEAHVAFGVDLSSNFDDPAKLEISSYSPQDPQNDISIYYYKKDTGCGYENRPANAKDWIAIYKKGASSDWKNVLKWAWVKDLKGYAPCDMKHEYRGVKKGLKKGSYVARLFKNNSYITNQSLEFNIENEIPEDDEVSLEIHPAGGYAHFAMISIQYKKDEGDVINRPENAKDWIAIFKKGAPINGNNVIKWRWVKDLAPVAPGDGAHEYVGYKKGLKNGSYVARFFKNNSYVVNKSLEFTVENQNSKNIIAEANKHCVPGSKHRSDILCSNEHPNNHRIAYAFDYKEEGKLTSKYDFVRIDLTTKTTEIIEANKTLFNGDFPFQSISLKFLKYTPVYLYHKEDHVGDHNQIWEFKYKKKTILKFTSNEKNGIVYKYDQTNKGKNLVIFRSPNHDDPANTKDKIFVLTYDISDPSIAKLINTKIIDRDDPSIKDDLAHYWF